MITTDDLEKLLDDLKMCPVGHSQRYIEIISRILSKVEKQPMQTVAIAIVKSPKIYTETEAGQ